MLELLGADEDELPADEEGACGCVEDETATGAEEDDAPEEASLLDEDSGTCVMLPEPDSLDTLDWSLADSGAAFPWQALTNNKIVTIPAANSFRT